MSRLSRKLNGLAREHQFVALLGARGTGKTHAFDELERAWAPSGVAVCRLDCHPMTSAADLLDPIERAIGCSLDEFGSHSAERLRSPVRILVDSGDQLVDRVWFSGAQERLRAMLSTPSARGRVGMTLAGRPLLRNLAGGEASPLLNLGPTVATEPLTAAEIQRISSLDEPMARAVRAWTGGHAQLSAELARLLQDGGRPINDVGREFAEARLAFLMKLMEDHGLSAVSLVAELATGAPGAREEVLIRRFYGSNVADGVEALRHLEACGVVARESGRCVLGGRLFHEIPFGAYPAVDEGDPVPGERTSVDEAVADLVWRLENGIRKLVVSELSAVTKTWWEERVPREIGTGAELRRRNELESAIGGARLHPVAFLSLGELFDLILSRRNWREVFSVALPLSETALREIAGSVTTVRNKAAHCRPCETHDLELLERTVRRLNIGEIADA